jgi:putative DNA primase/helicase
VSGPSAAELSAMLARRITVLAPELLPAGRRDGAEWRCGSLAGELGRSLAIHMHGSKAGIWADFASNERGDALDLIAHVLYAGDLARARRWALSWLGLGGDAPPSERREPPPAKANGREDAARKLAMAQRLWDQAIPPTRTPVERYLNSRGIELPDTDALKFHPDCPFGAERHPAMVAAMTDALTGRFCGLHRTGLRPDGSGKADTGKPKMMLGGAGVIRLTPDGEVGHSLAVAEGIENAATVAAMAFLPAWAVGSASGLAALPPLPGVSALHIWADPDSAGLAAAHRCARAWRAAGRDVHVLKPRGLGDWNDQLAQRGRHVRAA